MSLCHMAALNIFSVIRISDLPHFWNLRVFHAYTCPATVSSLRLNNKHSDQRGNWPDFCNLAYLWPDMNIDFNTPARAPPPGVTSNFDNPQSRAMAAHIGMGICIGITSVLIILRVYVKLAVTKLWGWDDCKGWHPAFLFRSFCSYFWSLTAAGTCLMAYVKHSFIWPLSCSDCRRHRYWSQHTTL
jgi:hypothetical protein